MRIECFNQPDENIDVDLYYCGYEDCNQGFHVGPSQRSEYLVHCVVNGSGFFKAEGTTYRVREGDCFLICPGEIHYYWCDEKPAWSFFWFAFNGRKAEKYLSTMRMTYETPVVRLDGKTADDLKTQVLAMIDLLEKGNRKTKILSHLYASFSNFENVETKWNIRKGKANEYVEKAILYIEYNYNKKISVSDVVKYLKLDRSYFTKIFKAHTGSSPQEYILKYRMERAIGLLENTDLRINEICKCVGIEEGYYFWRLFRRHMGCSPTEYKKEQFIK